MRWSLKVGRKRRVIAERRRGVELFLDAHSLPDLCQSKLKLLSFVEECARFLRAFVASQRVAQLSFHEDFLSFDRFVLAFH